MAAGSLNVNGALCLGLGMWNVELKPPPPPLGCLCQMQMTNDMWSPMSNDMFILITELQILRGLLVLY